jgi:hypothetical protein
MQVQLPIEGNRGSGKYGITVTAVDDAGNVRVWDRSYRVR